MGSGKDCRMKLTKETMDELRKEGYLVTRQGTEFIRYKGLLSLAHNEGLTTIAIDTIQLPDESNGNRCIIMATVSGDRGTYQDIGDASPKDLTGMIVPHLIRMAATRAKARALNNYLGIGICSVEELGGDTSKPVGRSPEQQRSEFLDNPQV